MEHIAVTLRFVWIPRKGDLCTVDGEGDTAFIVREAGKRSAYLARVDGRDGAIGHGREGLHKLHPLALADIEFVTIARSRRKP